MLSMKRCWVWLLVITVSQIHWNLIWNIYLLLNEERLTWWDIISYLPKYYRHKNWTGFWVHTLLTSVKKKHDSSSNFVFPHKLQLFLLLFFYWLFSQLGLFVVLSKFKCCCNYFDPVPTKRYCEIFLSL